MIFLIFFNAGIFSETAAQKLEELGIPFRQQRLVPEFMGHFPENYIIEVKKEPESRQKPECRIETLVIAMSHDFFMESPDFITFLEEETKLAKLPFSVTILISNEREPALLAEESNISGTDYFAERCYDVEETCALVLCNGPLSQSITATGAGETAPLWLVSSIKETASAFSRNYPILKPLFYSADAPIFMENSRSSSFLRRKIPASAFPSGHSRQDARIIAQICRSISEKNTAIWDRHYSCISFFNYNFWFSEGLSTMLYIILAIIILVSICFSSFRSSARNHGHVKDLSRTWFLVPLYILISGSALFFSQDIASSLKVSASTQFCVKFCIYIFAVLLAGFLQIFFRIVVSLSAIAFLGVVMTAVNVFFFTTVEISLLPLFFAEYFIIYSSHRWSNPVAMTASVGFMTIPAAIMMHTLALSMNSHSLKRIVHMSFSENIFLGMFLLPLVFTLIRFMIVTHMASRVNAVRWFHPLLRTTAFISVLFLVIWGGFLTVKRILSGSRIQETKVPVTEEEFIHETEISESTVFEMTRHRILIKQAEGKEMIRCRVEIETDSSSVHECNFDSETVNSTRKVLRIPDNPQDDINIIFSTDKDAAGQCRISIHSMDTDGKITLEQKTFRFGGRDET